MIVGSGAGGGMAAYVLAKAGMSVCIIEAGPTYDPRTNVTQFKNPWESPRRGAGTKWDWFRARMIGGRTNHWGRISLRFGPKDFKRRSIDGLGDDWPIGYEDIEPYYDKVDRLVGIFGSNEGLENDPDGIFLPPPKPRLHELLIKKAAHQVGVPVIPSRLSILTKKINEERGECIFCGSAAAPANRSKNARKKSGWTS